MERRSLLAFGCLALSGCTLLYWPSNAELVGNADGGAAADTGAVTATDGALPDAQAGAGGLQCPAKAILCDDFERDSGSGPFTKSSGATASSDVRAHSPTRSLSAIAKAGREAPYLETVLTLPTKATVSFWFYVATPPSRGDRDLRVAHVLWGDDCDWDLALTLYLRTSKGLRFDAAVYDAAENGNCGPILNSERVLLNAEDTFVPKWHHVVLKMDVSGKTRRTNATIDDVLVPSNDVTTKRSTVPKAARLALGVPCVNDGSGCLGWDGDDYEILIDDVTVVPTD